MSIVAKAVWFIEHHFSRCPTLDEVSAAAGTTRFHLCRSFRLATGRSVMSYMRGRRLTEAYKALSGGGRSSILLIALETGYNSHEAFTRAFRGQFGLTPEKVREGWIVENALLVEPIRMSETRNVDLEEPRIEHRDAMTIAGLSVALRMDEIQKIPQLWQDFQDYKGTLEEVPGRWYGVSDRRKRDDGRFVYIAGVEVERTGALPPELHVHQLPARKYLVFSHDGHIAELSRTMGAIFGGYLPDAGYDASTMETYFEQYDERFDPESGRGRIELWMPVIEKG